MRYMQYANNWYRVSLRIIEFLLVCVGAYGRCVYIITVLQLEPTTLLCGEDDLH